MLCCAVLVQATDAVIELIYCTSERGRPKDDMTRLVQMIVPEVMALRPRCAVLRLYGHGAGARAGAAAVPRQQQGRAEPRAGPGRGCNQGAVWGVEGVAFTFPAAVLLSQHCSAQCSAVRPWPCTKGSGRELGSAAVPTGTPPHTLCCSCCCRFLVCCQQARAEREGSALPETEHEESEETAKGMARLFAEVGEAYTDLISSGGWAGSAMPGAARRSVRSSAASRVPCEGGAEAGGPTAYQSVC